MHLPYRSVCKTSLKVYGAINGSNPLIGKFLGKVNTGHSQLPHFFECYFFFKYNNRLFPFLRLPMF